ncbi:MAG TPA: biotin transporter BioY [Armatimonadota bacterium]|nr:biotin transporter BioY [Armatimonadota bacterium]
MQETRLSPPALSLLQRSELARHAMLVLLFGALTAVSAQISIPWYPVPLTGQVFMVLVAGALLGPRLGLMSQLAYLAIGFLGAPVFAEGKATAAVMLGPTAGYLVGFVLAAWLAGWAGRYARSLPLFALGMAGASLLILAIGGAWLGLGSTLALWPGVPRHDLASGLSYGVTAGVLPFLLADVVKVAAATAFAWPLIRRAA